MIINMKDSEAAVFSAFMKKEKENNKKPNRKERRRLLFGRKKEEKSVDEIEGSDTQTSNFSDDTSVSSLKTDTLASSDSILSDKKLIESDNPVSSDIFSSKDSGYKRKVFRIRRRIHRKNNSIDESPVILKNDSQMANIEINGPEMLHHITQNPAVEEVLYPTVTPYLDGLRCFFIAHPGTYREEYIYKYTDLLFKLGKINHTQPYIYNFGAVPETIKSKELYIISDLDSAINHLFNLEDFSDEASHKQKIYHDILMRLLKAPLDSFIIFSCSEEEYRGFLLLDAKIPYIFSKRIFFSDLTDEQLYSAFEDSLPEIHKNQITAEFKEKAIGFINRNRRFYPFYNQELASYLAQYASNQPELILPPEKYNPKALQETFSNIIGLDEVKKQVLELERYLSIRNKLVEKGVRPPDFNLHMMFLGNPGVGKTTIARAIAKLLFDLGYLREDKLVEVTSKDLIGAYGNQTGIKTNKAIMSALGGVLFVDEAYSLSMNCGSAGAEAIAILIKAMMDYKDDLVVMFAGYSLEMRQFIESNSGIASRISYLFKFEDYTEEQLFDIFMLKLKNIGMNLSPDAEPAVRTQCKNFAKRRNAGNGRFVDNLIQKCLTKHALLDLSEDELLTLQYKSIPKLEELMTTIN